MANGDNNPPSGYHEVPAPSEGGVPSGYHEVPAPVETAAPSGPFHPQGPMQPTQVAEPSFSDKALGWLRDTALSAGQTMVPNATTDPIQNLKNIGTGMNTAVNQAATTPWAQGGPIWGTLAMIGNALMGNLHGTATGIEKFGKGAMSGDAESMTSGAGEALGNAVQLYGMKKTPESLEQPILPRETVQNIINQGPRKAAFIGRQIETANAIQQHIKPAMDALHADGKNLMGDVSSHIDAAKPGGVFKRADVANTLKDATGVIEDESKVPSFLKKSMTPETSKQTTGPAVGGKRLDLSDPQQLKAYQKMKEQGAYTPEEIKRIEGGATGMMPFEELKQLHSDIGSHLANTEGVQEAGLKAAYAKTGEMLRKEADSHGMLAQWQEGINKVRTFNDILRTDGMKDVYYGDNHGQIMGALIDDKKGPVIGRKLEAIAPYGIDMETLGNTIGKYKFGDTWDRMSEPTKLTLFMAAFAPKLAAIRTGLPQMIRSKFITNLMYPDTLEGVAPTKPETLAPSKIKAKQVSIRNNP